jgi:Family of unknown function (DUF6535)
MHAFFAEGVDNMHIQWAVEGLPTLLHLSLFLFFGGLVIFLFNVDQEVFLCVVWWIGLFTLMYGLITLLPFTRHNTPYYSPLSLPAWFLHAGIPYVIFKILSSIAYRYRGYDTWVRYRDLRDHYRDWMLGGVEKAAEEVASTRSSEIDVRIFGWTIGALGDDDSLEKFFEAIPGFFQSKLVKDLERDFPETHLNTFWGVLDAFMGRTSSSNSVTEPVKSHRVNICRDIASMVPCLNHRLWNAYPNIYSHFYQAPVSIERSQAMARWITHSSRDVSDAARIRVSRNLVRIQERDNRWIALASDAYSLAAHIEHTAAMSGDDVLLAILIDVSRQAIHSYKFYMLELVTTLTRFDIRHTLPGLQHDFCTLWNELVQEAMKRGPYSTPINILLRIRRLYITLHQGTNAAPTAFSASTDTFDTAILLEGSSYPLCDIASHRPDSIAQVPHPAQPAHSPDASPRRSTSGGNSASQQVNEASNIARPSSRPDLTTPSEIGDSSPAPEASSPTLLALNGPHPTDASPPDAVATALQDIPLAATLSHHLERTRQDMIAPCPEPDISENMSTVSTLASAPTLTPVPTSTQHVLNTSLTSHDIGAVSTSDPLPPTSSVVGFSIPVSPPSPRVPPSPQIPSHPPKNATVPCLRAHGLVNSGNMCSANAVLHLFVHTPPFRNLFRGLGDLKGKRGGGPETCSGATPLVDAMVRFFEEFVVKEPPMQQPPQRAAGGNPSEDEDATKEHNVVNPTNMYDAMKKKGRLETFMVRSVQRSSLTCADPMYTGRPAAGCGRVFPPLPGRS